MWLEFLLLVIAAGAQTHSAPHWAQQPQRNYILPRYYCPLTKDDKLHSNIYLGYIVEYGQPCKNAAQTCRKICEVYGADAVSERKRRTQELFIQFRSGNFDVKDRPRSDRSVTEKVDEILQLVEQDRHVSCQEIINALRINHVTVWNDLKKAGYAKKLDVWVPHELTQRNLIDRISISEILLKRNEIDPFLKQIITGDEKWVKYKNIVRKRSWSKRGEPPQTTSKPGLTANKVMLCVWWDWKGVVHHEVLPHGLTVNSELYCSQLDRLQEAIKEKRLELINRKSVVFHHNNARPHTSLMTPKIMITKN
ncbi:PREDICTED: histone-lysine N-methyltransferase SETMAR-like [Acromyrmex echinatior]|uniref:histone-lysine N-methyltransferase SETMAR-like n=1 Tax=Acromyrmex echinatior TaxID=103372 RepID=UPI000580F936|nr:PREDICTED: histone-lysine N-methyltransferase SETMAR-like [Acromyrmex echinatior]